MRLSTRKQHVTCFVHLPSKLVHLLQAKMSEGWRRILLAIDSVLKRLKQAFRLFPLGFQGDSKYVPE